MQQLFPEVLDDVDPLEVYRADLRSPVGDRPWVMLNMIASVDGGIAVDGKSGGLGGAGDKAVFDALRSIPDVIVVASGTALAESYGPPKIAEALQSERVAAGLEPQPRLAIVTRSLNIAPDHQVFGARPFIITTGHSDHAKRRQLAEVADIVIAGDDEVDLADALGQLGESGTRTVLLEGGPTLNGAFTDADLVDELCLSVAPYLLGGASPRIVNQSTEAALRALGLDRVLHHEGTLFYRYLRNR